MAKDFFRNKYHPYFKSIEESCLKIQKINPKFNSFQFVNRALNHGKHPQAISDSLQTYICYSESIKNCWAYLNRVLQVRSGNYWEKDHIENHEQVKQEFNEYMASSELKDILSGIGKKV